LVWNLPKHSFSQSILAQVFEFLELDELDNVSTDTVAEVVLEGFAITVELTHELEAFIANSDNDDGAGEARSLDDVLDGLLHVVDLSVSQNEQNVINSCRSGLCNSAQEGLQ